MNMNTDSNQNDSINRDEKNQVDKNNDNNDHLERSPELLSGFRDTVEEHPLPPEAHPPGPFLMSFTFTFITTKTIINSNHQRFSAGSVWEDVCVEVSVSLSWHYPRYL